MIIQYMRPEGTLTTMCQRRGRPEEPAQYQQVAAKRRAVYLSLFNGPFMSWPYYAGTLFGDNLPQKQSHEMLQQVGPEIPDDEIYTMLTRLFKDAQTKHEQKILRRQRVPLQEEGRAE